MLWNVKDGSILYSKTITFDPINFNFKRTCFITIDDILEDVDQAIEPLATAAKELIGFNPN